MFDKRKWKKSLSAIITLSLILQLFVPVFSSVAFAADPNNISLSISSITTGTAPFSGPAGHNPGFDSSPNDDYVRTLDTVTYTFNYQINPAGTTASNSALTATLTQDSKGRTVSIWDPELAKTYPGLTFSDDGRTFVYELGTKDGGTVYKFDADAKVLGTAEDGEIFNVDARFSTDSFPTPATTSGRDITISAIPKLDLGIDIYDISKPAVHPTTGKLGLIILSSVYMTIGEGKGSEIIDEDLNFKVDLSQLRSKGINPILYDFSSYSAADRNGRGPASYYLAPYGLGANENSVSHSGNFTTTQDASGDVTINIADANTSGDHRPSKYPNGNTIAADKTYVVSGYLALWVDQDEIPLNGTKIDGTPSEGT